MKTLNLTDEEARIVEYVLENELSHPAILEDDSEDGEAYRAQLTAILRKLDSDMVE